MTVLKLGVHCLPAAEVALIRSLIRLYSHAPSFCWRFVEAGPCDVLIVDGGLLVSDPQSDEARRRAPGALRVVRGRCGDVADTLQRPIRADQLRTWLERKAIELLKSPAAPTGAADRPLRFRLRRWPSAALLGEDPQRIRLAALLSRRALAVRELSAISQWPTEHCQAFVDALHQAGLLQIHDTGVASPAPAPVRPAHPASFAEGLVAGIRRRLGL